MSNLLPPQWTPHFGYGCDVHRFENTANTGRKLILCGVEIEHDFALTGHSDADVGLHALTDALLAALGENDIGFHFPPSDDTFKDMDSAKFLEKPLDFLSNSQGCITNVGITLICQSPRIGKYREAMREKVAKILGISATQVNIAATTFEKLGFTGRGEGIEARATACIIIPTAINSNEKSCPET